MTPNVQKAVTLYPERAADYAWFDVEQLTEDDVMGLTHDQIGNWLRQPMPFPKCAIAGTSPIDTDLNGVVFGVLVTRGPKESNFEDAVFVETSVVNSVTNRIARHTGFWLRYDQLAADGLKIYFDNPDDFKDESIVELSRVSSIVLGKLLKTIHAQDAEYKAYAAIPKSNNTKRIRQGKKPMFDWRTVVIDLPKQKFPHQGGTHATPRLHDVRGHWVTRNGKKFWRKPHQRGDASKGVVFHDYKIKSTTPEAHK
jgi:hypothetical protein